MTRKSPVKPVTELKALAAEDGDLLRGILQIAIREFLEAAMKGESRT